MPTQVAKQVAIKYLHVPLVSSSFCFIATRSIPLASYLFTDNASEEQRKEFLGEIELMKEIGKHQNVLSFVGCWTMTKPLYLVIEYVAHGDLRQWLIRKRRQVTFSKTYCLKCFWVVIIHVCWFGNAPGH